MELHRTGCYAPGCGIMYRHCCYPLAVGRAATEGGAFAAARPGDDELSLPATAWQFWSQRPTIFDRY